MSIRRWTLGLGAGLVALVLTTLGDNTTSVRTHAMSVYAVVMSSPREGWLLTAHGAVDWTRNGWKSWDTIERLGRPRFNRTSYLTGHSSRESWIAQWTAHSHRLMVFVSRDSGKHWKSVVTHLPFTSLDSSEAIINLTWFGSKAILETSGAHNTIDLWDLQRDGKGWRRIDATFNFYSVSAVTWASPTTGYAVGFLPIVNVTPLWVTTDGGVTWRLASLPHPSPENTWQLYLDGAIPTSQGVVIPEQWFTTGASSQMSYALSSEGISGWRQSPRLPMALELNQWVSSRAGWGFAHHQVWITENGGVTWQAYTVPFATKSLDGQNADLVTSRVGWVWTSTPHGTTLWQTKNSGRSWQSIPL